MRLQGVTNPATAATLARFQRALARALTRVGLVPLSPLAEAAPAGGGYHYGASVPMSRATRRGRGGPARTPRPAQLMHVVDAACLPSIPGGTVTFPAMANAHRIATAATRTEADHDRRDRRQRIRWRADSLAPARERERRDRARAPAGRRRQGRAPLRARASRWIPALLDGVETVVHAAYDPSARGERVAAVNCAAASRCLTASPSAAAGWC